MLQEETERLNRTIEEQKDNIKRLIAQIKDVEAMEGDEKSKVAKLTEKLRDIERDLQEFKESL